MVHVELWSPGCEIGRLECVATHTQRVARTYSEQELAPFPFLEAFEVLFEPAGMERIPRQAFS
jgi:hypothetical protein